MINTVSSQLMENTCSYCYHIIRASNQIYTGSADSTRSPSAKDGLTIWE
ncbi:hypothetical protein HanXRQr2_Chr15g0698631 [Helianthus annuus]|uniref:Uncharacterized protein n=1 Tax=Helianthus annuus TaxID=4232 RepID=A0A9K3E2U8_HELAN|nr:hypothetical protein HanXRQr2_Chr15g0698631 [Helianthus annuus]KAJ0831717.1 hypothetical protein HanPSC8_Chr15g0670301 [Helianthus annuus]